MLLMFPKVNDFGFAAGSFGKDGSITLPLTDACRVPRIDDPAFFFGLIHSNSWFLNNVGLPELLKFAKICSSSVSWFFS